MATQRHEVKTWWDHVSLQPRWWALTHLEGSAAADNYFVNTCWKKVVDGRCHCCICISVFVSHFPTVWLLGGTESLATDHLWCCRLENELSRVSTPPSYSCVLLCVSSALLSIVYYYHYLTAVHLMTQRHLWDFRSRPRGWNRLGRCKWIKSFSMFLIPRGFFCRTKIMFVFKCSHLVYLFIFSVRAIWWGVQWICWHIRSCKLGFSQLNGSDLLFVSGRMRWEKKNTLAGFAFFCVYLVLQQPMALQRECRKSRWMTSLHHHTAVCSRSTGQTTFNSHFRIIIIGVSLNAVCFAAFFRLYVSVLSVWVGSVLQQCTTTLQRS